MQEKIGIEKYFFVLPVILFLVLFFGACGSRAAEESTEVQPVLETVSVSDPVHNQEVMAEHDTAMDVETQEIQILPGIYEPLEFSEIWAYLIDYDEASLKKTYPVTDIGYFGAGLSTFGKLTGVPSVKRLSQYTGRVHLVIADNSKSLTHFCLDPSFSVRNELLSSIIQAAENFDGVQIDFEFVSPADKEYFWSFLKELKEGLNGKILSAAVPARTKTLSDDAYDYKVLSEIADRIIVMAYDEHWSGSKPGSIASLSWCRTIAAYAMSVIPDRTLVMGFPFYGRAWSDDDTTGAYRNSSVKRVMEEQGIREPDRILGIPSFTFSKTVTFTFYYEDIQSIYSRLCLYKEKDVQSVAFWRLGQEDALIWQYLKAQ